MLIRGKGNGRCVNTNLLSNKTDNLSRTVEQFWVIKSYEMVSKDSISLKSLQKQKALNFSKIRLNAKTTDTLSEI